jgi:hypothetical protein
MSHDYHMQASQEYNDYVITAVSYIQ